MIHSNNYQTDGDKKCEHLDFLVSSWDITPLVFSQSSHVVYGSFTVTSSPQFLHYILLDLRCTFSSYKAWLYTP